MEKRKPEGGTRKKLRVGEMRRNRQNLFRFGQKQTTEIRYYFFN